MRFLGIGIGHCNQHPTEADPGPGDGNDFQTCVDDGGESDGDTAEEDNQTQDDEDEGTDLEEYDEVYSDEYDDDDFGYDNL